MENPLSLCFHFCNYKQICCTITHLFLYESRRWLFMQGRVKDALAVLKRIRSTDHINTTSLMEPGTKPNNQKPFSSVTILLKKKWAIQRLLVVMILSFGMGLVYSGTFLGVGILGLNIYQITTFNCLLFLASSVLSYLFWIPRCNRRTSLLGFCMICGFSSIISTLVSHYQQALQVILELVFNILFMYVVENGDVPNLCQKLCNCTVKTGIARCLTLCAYFGGDRNEIWACHPLGVRSYGSPFRYFGNLVARDEGKMLCDTTEEQEVRDKGWCMSII